MSNLYTRTIEPERLQRSYERTQQGIRKYRKAAIIFEMSRERKLAELQEELEQHTYKPGKYNKIIVYEPKERVVHAPYIRDKIVQFAAHEILQEVYDPIFITDTYACFKEVWHSPLKTFLCVVPSAMRWQNSPSTKPG